MGDGTTRIYFRFKHKELFTTIDTEDVPRAKAFTWTTTSITARNLTRYATSTIGGKTVLLHRLIMSFPLKGQIDHMDQLGLNNTKSNLRVISASMNCLNKPAYSKKRENMPKGIRKRYFKTCIKYNARIRIKGKLIQGGTYSTVEEAVASRDSLEKKYWAELEAEYYL